MSAFIAFTKKEILEFHRTYKLLVMGILAIVIGMYSPLVTLAMPKLMQSISSADNSGLTILVDESAITAMQSWTQFYTDVPLTLFIVCIIIFSGLVSNEISKGTLLNVLTKGLSRKTVILSKFAFMFGVWTIFYVISILISWGYTAYFWDSSDIDVGKLLFGFLCIWIYGNFLLGILLLTGAVFRSNYGVLLCTGCVYMLTSLINMIPNVARINPAILQSCGMSFLTGTEEISYAYPAIILTIIATIIIVALSVVVFDKKKL